MNISYFRQGYVPQACAAITPSDTGLALNFRGFMVATAGNVGIEFTNGVIGVMPACQPGVQYGAAILRLRDTGTTATGIVGLR